MVGTVEMAQWSKRFHAIQSGLEVKTQWLKAWARFNGQQRWRRKEIKGKRDQRVNKHKKAVFSWEKIK